MAERIITWPDEVLEAASILTDEQRSGGLLGEGFPLRGMSEDDRKKLERKAVNKIAKTNGVSRKMVKESFELAKLMALREIPFS